MVWGYDGPRPVQRHYQKFLDELVDRLNLLGKQGLSLMLYGSYARGDAQYGRSDIDALIIFPQDIVIDKGMIRGVQHGIKDALLNSNPVLRDGFQVTPLDKGILHDGRFTSFTPDFEPYFGLEGKVIVGPDYRPEMRYRENLNIEMATLSHRLRKARNALLFSVYDRERNYKQFLRGFYSTLCGVSRGSNQVLSLIDGRLRHAKFSPVHEVEAHFPNVDSVALRTIQELFGNLSLLDELYHEPMEVQNLWGKSITFFEELIHTYVNRFPNGKNGVVGT
jgi:hypothetical protein